MFYKFLELIWGPKGPLRTLKRVYIFSAIVSLLGALGAALQTNWAQGLATLLILGCVATVADVVLFFVDRHYFTDDETADDEV